MRLYGIPEELKLAIEESGGSVKAAEMTIAEAARIAEENTKNAIREIQSVIGPHGAISRLQAGGVNISPRGINVYEDGIQKTTIYPDGNFRVGSNIDEPSTTTFNLFVNEQIYNAEEFGAGDMLIGNNSSGEANVFYDASEGRLNFRGGTTVEVYIDTDGTLNAGGGNVRMTSEGIELANSATSWFRFEDANGNYDTITIAADPNNDFEFTNLATSPAGTISFFTKDEGGTTRRILRITGDTLTRLEIGADHYFPTRDSSNPNGFWNEANQDMDFTFEGDTAAIVLKIDAGLDAVGIGGEAESGYKLKVHGKVNLASGNTYDINGSAHQHNSTQIFGNFVNATVPAATTSSTAPWKDALNATGNSVPIPETGTLSHLTVRMSTAQPGTGSLVCTLLVNTVATSVVVTIPAGSAAGTYQDATNTAAINAGDVVRWDIQNNAPAAASGNVVNVTMKLTKSTT